MKKRYWIILILLLGLFLRLIHITFPVGGFAGWRQADTAAMAHNFYTNGFDILQPQIDWGGNSNGYVETEFPLYSFLVALCYKLFSPDDLWGRLLSVIFSLGAIYGLYLLVRKCIDEDTALWSALVYAIIPLNVFYGRALMPEPMMLMCSIWGIYFFSVWISNGKLVVLVLSAMSLALAALLKIPALYLGIPLLFLVWRKFGITFLRNPWLWIFAFLILAPVTLWYYHAHQTFLQSGLTFGIWDYGTGKWGNFSLLLSFKFYNDVLFKSIAERHLTYPGFFLFLIGLFVPRSRNDEKLFLWWLVGLGVYLIIVARGNQAHEYYQLPFSIPACVYIGKTLREVMAPASFRFYRRNRRIVLACILASMVALPLLSILRIQSFMEGERLNGSLFQLGNGVMQETATDRRIVTVDGGDPVILYQCHRKGWHASPDDITPALLESLHFQGASYVAGTIEMFDSPERHQRLLDILRSFPAVTLNGSYFILRLTL
jgi:4-amino-4-deoxy-L-arabinose transferase-like glycosyltransferase